jgi:hypothetical protein
MVHFVCVHVCGGVGGCACVYCGGSSDVVGTAAVLLIAIIVPHPRLCVALLRDAHCAARARFRAHGRLCGPVRLPETGAPPLASALRRVAAPRREMRRGRAAPVAVEAVI